MIIGISGKIGSGKDTVGQIIQMLLAKQPYEKSHIEDFVKDNIKLLETASDWKVKKFAGKLKQITALLTGCTVEDLESQEFKDSDLGPEWKRKIYTNPERTHFVNTSMTYREVLQKIGTEAMRDNVHTDVWINALFADYKTTASNFDCDGNTTVLETPNWIITDMRFQNEFDAVKARGGVTIRVERKKFPIEHSKTGETHLLSREAFVEHPSETALDNHNFDYVIHNDSSISDLIDSVKEVLRKLKVI